MQTTAINPAACPYCGMLHTIEQCWRVRRIEYADNGMIRAVEFHGQQPVEAVKPTALRAMPSRTAGGPDA